MTSSFAIVNDSLSLVDEKIALFILISGLATCMNDQLMTVVTLGSWFISRYLGSNKDLNIFIQGDVIIAMCARNCNCPKVELTIFLNEFIHCFQNFVKNLRTGHEENCIISYQLLVYSYILSLKSLHCIQVRRILFIPVFKPMRPTQFAITASL